MAQCSCEEEAQNVKEKKVLLTLLAINAFMFLFEIIFGVMSESTAVIADSLDMLADATVYGITLYAVGKSLLQKANAALLSGIFETILGVSVLIDVIRRFIFGSEPLSIVMIVIGFIALAANVVCLMIISKNRNGEVHMRASWVFSKNDVIANVGIILGGVLVYLLDSRFPDLIIGLIISIVVIRGGIFIIKDATNERRHCTTPSP